VEVSNLIFLAYWRFSISSEFEPGVCGVCGNVLVCCSTRTLTSGLIGAQLRRR
jgi:hypothetical protein